MIWVWSVEVFLRRWRRTHYCPSLIFIVGSLLEANKSSSRKLFTPFLSSSIVLMKFHSITLLNIIPWGLVSAVSRSLYPVVRSSILEISLSVTHIRTDKCNRLTPRPAQTRLGLPLQIRHQLKAKDPPARPLRQTTDPATDSPVSNPGKGAAHPWPLKVQILDYEGDIGP